ncbi:uncharacterized protein LOC111946944 isoform X1 [Oryzias latipes]|uniref:uncharacterized protein LOC111946944 isoform X1 n=1 Tax=Oryzias latipes TaxID=8090 RepID=UPI000CE271A6|nr:uncharacterized protein LOC111946944 isoform X1 [Oryzias latipes]XP_023808246.1 uncharacterized protein LOC111946944 isoform X1 [Oryzias latipes]
MKLESLISCNCMKKSLPIAPCPLHLNGLTQASSSSASASTILLDEIPRKKSRVKGTINAVSAKKLIEAVLGTSSGGEEVLEEYHTSQTLKDSTRRKLVNTIVAHMIDKHRHLPTKAVREEYALGIVTLFPSLKDPYSKKGYEHFYDAASSTGYISWRLKTIQRKIRRECTTSNSLTGLSQGQGGPKFQRSVVVEEQQLDGDACQEAMSLLNHATDTTLIFRKMRETFQHRQKLVNDSDKALDILSCFPRFLDTKGLANQDFILLFNDEVSNQLLQKWDPIFRCNIIKEAKQLTSTPELRQLLHSAESPQGSDETMTHDAEMASLLLLLYLPPPPGGPKYPKISASDAVEKVDFLKSYCSLEEHLQNQHHHQLYLLAVGREKRNIDRFYISIDNHLIPCQANRSLGAFDELFKAHFVFSVSYDGALLNFYTFLQTTVYNIDMGKMKVSPKVSRHEPNSLSRRCFSQPRFKVKAIKGILIKMLMFFVQESLSQQLISHMS